MAKVVRKKKARNENMARITKGMPAVVPVFQSPLGLLSQSISPNHLVVRNMITGPQWPMFTRLRRGLWLNLIATIQCRFKTRKAMNNQS